MTYELVLGLGGTVDFELTWDAELLSALAQQYRIVREELDVAAPISDERSLVCSILAHLDADQGGEKFVDSSQLGFDFAARFEYKVTLGGTCVRAALAIAKLGVSSLVHLVSIDDNVRRLLPPEIDYLSSATRDTLDPHVIVQFPAGATVEMLEGEVRAVHPNRIILVNDPPNRDLVLSPELPDALAGARAFLPAGFNVMRDPALLVDRIAFLQQAMTRLPAEAVVFYEEAGFHDTSLREIVRRDFRGRIDVHSLNEDELQSYLGRKVRLLDPDDVLAALDAFSEFAIAPTVVVHTKYWSMALGPRAAAFEQALAGGIDLASTRYCCGDDFTVADLNRVRQSAVHPGGAEFAEQLRGRLGEAVRCVPGRVLDVPRPTTIGLGDTFVGGFLATLVHGPLAVETPQEAAAC